VKTTITGHYQGSLGFLSWDAGVLDGTDGPLSKLREFEGPTGPGPHYPSTEDTPDLSKLYDWYLAALTVFGPYDDNHVEGPVPALPHHDPNVVS
jgi:hypothetical protein